MPRRVTSATKPCTGCGEVKSRSEFSRQLTQGPNSIKPKCKVCERLHRQRWELGLEGERLARYQESRRKSDRKRCASKRRENRKERRDRVETSATIIRQLRGRGMSYRQMSQLSGLARSTLVRYEREGVAKAPHDRIARTLGDLYTEVLARERDERMKHEDAPCHQRPNS